MTWQRRVSVYALLVASAVEGAGCGGLVEGSVGDAAAPPVTDGSPSTDGSVLINSCASSTGDRICNGPNGCPSDGACGCSDVVDGGAISVCVLSPGWVGGPCYDTTDGNVCVEVFPGVWNVAAFDFGLLYQANDAGDQVREADYGLWTGDPLPNSTSCPPIPNAQLCGSACGACSQGLECIGHAPLHPYPICVDPNAPSCTSASCNEGFGCFQYTVQSAAQAMADAYGRCLPAAQCQSLAMNLPGGAKCLIP